MHVSDLTVIIPTYQRRELVLRNLPRVREQAPFPTRILVLDQTRPAENGFEHRVRAAGADYLWLPKAGLPGARNQGMSRIQTLAAVFLDDDAEPQPGWLPALAARLDTYPCVTGRIWDRDLNIGPAVYAFDRENGHYHINVSRPEPQEVISLSGGNFALTREAWQAAGGFYEGFQGLANWEEVDFACRLRQTGRKIFYEPGAAVVHHRPGSGGCQAEQRPVRYHRERFYNDGLFFGRHPGIIPWSAVWRREKYDIEFHTRGESGRKWRQVVKYFGSFSRGWVRGKLSMVKSQTANHK